MKVVGLAAIVMACAGCSKPAPSASALDDRQAALNAIADRCRMPRSSWKLIDETRVALDVARNTDVAKSTCLLTEFNKSHLPLKLGFIGREYYPDAHP